MPSKPPLITRSLDFNLPIGFFPVPNTKDENSFRRLGIDYTIISDTIFEEPAKLSCEWNASLWIIGKCLLEFGEDAAYVGLIEPTQIAGD